MFFPLVDWHARLQRSQHLAKALADMGHLCIYVNPHLGLEYYSPQLLSPEARLSVLYPGIFELHVHLPAEHPIDARRLRPPEVARIVRAIDILLNDLEIRDAIQIVSLPSWFEVVMALRDQRGFPVLYDCHDYLSGFQRLAREIVDSEALLFEHCDQVAFSAQYLMDISIASAPATGSKALLLRNANDPEDFVFPMKSQPCGVRARVGYAGSLDHWFDVELIAETAARLPDVDFVLAGRIEDSRIRRLERCGNVHFTGEIPYSAVPKFLHSCDAAIIPFCRIPLTLATNPIKLYEYFSAGLPVVSTRLPEVELYKDLVYIADTKEQFGAFLRDAVSEGNPQLREQRIATARSESWQSRAHTLVDRLNRSEMNREVTVFNKI